MMLAREGLDVTVLEADPAEPPAPADAWSSWTRKGVAQFRQPHNLFGRFRQICDDELPELTDKLLAAGCVWVDVLETLPPPSTTALPGPVTTGCGSLPAGARSSNACSPKPHATSRA